MQAPGLQWNRGRIMPERVALARNIKTMRKQMRESQIEFAAHCGISAEALSLLERERSDPKLSTMQKLAAYMDQTVSDLLNTETE